MHQGCQRTRHGVRAHVLEAIPSLTELVGTVRIYLYVAVLISIRLGCTSSIVRIRILSSTPENTAALGASKRIESSRQSSNATMEPCRHPTIL
jgi:hypothetical protein